jgi:restriction system protein
MSLLEEENFMAPKERNVGGLIVPQPAEFFWPVIRALQETGGSASNAEMLERVVADMKLGEDLVAVPHGSGLESEVGYRLAWARTYLKYVGAIDNSERGIWTLTSKGRTFTEKDVVDVERQARAAMRGQSPPLSGGESTPTEITEASAEASEPDWKDALLGFLKAMPPENFERLCQRILRESGFTKVQVTGRSGDGGIDGAGVLRVNLVSFHVVFQCKRWKDVVPASVIREFRGAMSGRADKGLMMTTGRFTPDAQREAVRDGASAIDLVDGETLCDLLRNLRLGVQVRNVEVVEFRPDQLEEA